MRASLCFAFSIFVPALPTLRQGKTGKGTKGKLRDTSIRPFIVETALSRQVQPNYKNSCAGSDLSRVRFATFHLPSISPAPGSAALPSYFTFIVGLPQLQLRNARPRESTRIENRITLIYILFITAPRRRLRDDGPILPDIDMCTGYFTSQV